MEVRKMGRPSRSVAVHECFFMEQAKRVKSAISEILQKDSLSVADTKAIRVLTDVYDSLTNPVLENYVHCRADCNNGHFEESQ